MSRDIETVAREVIGYFRRTAAVDTLEGIARWRLTQQQIDYTVDETAAALQLLMARGLVEEVPSAAGARLYRLIAAKDAAVEELMDGEENRP